MLEFVIYAENLKDGKISINQNIIKLDIPEPVKNVEIFKKDNIEKLKDEK